MTESILDSKQPSSLIPFSNIQLESVRGVGRICLKLDRTSKVHVFIGENGIGKTKLLESLFQFFLSSSKSLVLSNDVSSIVFNSWMLSKITIENYSYYFPKEPHFLSKIPSIIYNEFNIDALHSLPIVYMASQNRGFIKHVKKPIQAIGDLSQRRGNYITSLFVGMKDNFSNLNMDTNIEEWFVIRAQSSNTYQKQEDNRKVEIDTVLNLLNKLDKRIDVSFLEISGDNRVSIKINDEKRELSHLSTGFASILKIIQSIISGYGYFTNEVNLQTVKGIVLIDEIESHLHISWQSKIIPLLKKLFPNTIFYITTHSSVVFSQLEEGEAHRLGRENDGVVRSTMIPSPGKSAFVDVLKDAFDLDLNKIKLERMSAEKQKDAKKQLLDLLEQGISSDD
jgi:predicted ATP-binding protein involved in virulence